MMRVVPVVDFPFAASLVGLSPGQNFQRRFYPLLSECRLLLGSATVKRGMTSS